MVQAGVGYLLDASALAEDEAGSTERIAAWGIGHRESAPIDQTTGGAPGPRVRDLYGHRIDALARPRLPGVRWQLVLTTSVGQLDRRQTVPNCRLVPHVRDRVREQRARHHVVI